MPITSFDIDPQIQEELREVLAADPVEYPNMGNFINRAIRDKLKSIKAAQGGANGSDSMPVK
jgi:Arc/MetJ-type ribon-helix-helix transcriptional regulator